MVHEQAFEVRIAVGLAGAVVPVVFPERGQFFEPLVDIQDQPVLRIVDVDARRNVHGGDEDHAFADAAFGERRIHLRGDVDVFAVLLCTKSQILCVEAHARDHNRQGAARKAVTLRVIEGPPNPRELMKRFPAPWIFLLWGMAALAQQPSTDPAGQAPSTPAPLVQPATDEPEDRIRKDDRQAPPTPLEEREKEIRKVDPLTRDDEQSAEEKANEEQEKETEQRRNVEQAPLPGSIAANEARDAVARTGGPQVVGDEAGGAQTPQYTGPAVLSHSYTLNSGLIPTNLQWVTSFGLSSVYNTGINTAGAGPQGPIQNASSFGTSMTWGISGRHKFHRDSLGLAYTGSRPWYSQGDQYTGATTRLAVDYTHIVSRRLSVRFSGTGDFLSQSSALENPAPGPATSAADVNTAIAPGPQIFNTASKAFTTGVSASWQRSTRLSFTAAVSYFVNMYDIAGLTGVGGEQAQGSMNYRLTSKTTAGVFYSYSVYNYQHGQGTSNSQSIGGLYSYAFDRSTRLQLRAGGGNTEMLARQTVPLSPIAAALFGLPSEIIESYQKSLTQDISAQFSRDFGNRGTVSVSFSKGISPGNGLYLASTSETIGVAMSTRLFHRYLVTFNAGRQSLSQTLSMSGAGTYLTDYARITSSKPMSHNMALTYGLSYTYYQITAFPGLRNEFAMNCGFTWSHSEDRLWPLHGRF